MVKDGNYWWLHEQYTLAMTNALKMVLGIKKIKEVRLESGRWFDCKAVIGAIMETHSDSEGLLKIREKYPAHRWLAKPPEEAWGPWKEDWTWKESGR
jgi:hypothetical protein